jgi:hypothetical protein
VLLRVACAVVSAPPSFAVLSDASCCRGEGRKAREKAKVTYDHAAETSPLAPVSDFDAGGLEHDNANQLCGYANHLS